jgi:pilus assembly protein Flp/PilA
MQIRQRTRAFVHDDEAVTAIEYGLIAALIAVAIIVSVTLIGSQLAVVFNYIAGFLAT